MAQDLKKEQLPKAKLYRCKEKQDRDMCFQWVDDFMTDTNLCFDRITWPPISTFSMCVKI